MGDRGVRASDNTVAEHHTAEEFSIGSRKRVRGNVRGARGMARALSNGGGGGGGLERAPKGNGLGGAPGGRPREGWQGKGERRKGEGKKKAEVGKGANQVGKVREGGKGGKRGKKS